MSVPNFLQHPLSSDISQYLLNMFKQHPIVIEMGHKLQQAATNGTVVYPCNCPVKLAYLMHVSPTSYFVEVDNVLLAPPTYLRFIPAVAGEQTSLSIMPWISTGNSEASGKALAVKEELNAFYFFTLPYTSLLKSCSAKELGF